MNVDPPDTPMLHSNIPQAPARKLKQYVAATAVSLGAVCAGTCLSWTSPALAQLSLPTNNTNTTLNSTDEFQLPQPFYVTDNEGALIGGILTIGALITAIPAGYLADKFGRKKIIFSISLAFTLNWLLIIFAQNSAMIIAGRFFAGVGTGAICVTGPMYIGEIAENSLRGILAAFINMFLCSGILLTCIFGSFTTWRVLSMILATVPVIFAVAFFFMPETPAYLVACNNNEAAERSLRSLRGPDYDITTELKEIKKEIEESRDKSLTLLEVFTSRANIRAFLAVVPILAFQQLCGVNAVVFYTVAIFKAAGSSLSPDIPGIIIGCVQVIGAYASIFIIERANRRFYLMLSSTGMMLFMTSLALYFHLKSLNVDVNHLSYLPVASAVLFMVFFSIGYGPVPWLLMGELFSPEIKGIGSGFAILTNWGCAFLVTFFFPIINGALGSHVSFYICSAIMAGATVYVYFLVPETRGKTLFEIQEILNK